MTDHTPGASRLLTTAVAGSTLSLVVLGSAVMAGPAAAAPQAPRTVASNTLHTSGSIPSQLSAPRALSALPVPTARSGATYTVRRGDTLSHIALRTDVSLSTLMKANGLKRTSIIHPGQILKLAEPAPTRGSTKTDRSRPAAAPTRAAVKTHTVRAGDTLSHIAARHGVSVATLQSANDLGRSSLIRPGQVLKLAAASPAKAAAATTRSPQAAAPATYTIKRGDTLSGIASRHGMRLQDLLSANGLKRSAIIHPGTVLRLSGGASVERASSTSSAKPKSKPQKEQLVPSTFLHYRYPDHVVASANQNKRALLDSPIPSRAQTVALIRDTARKMGVDPRLALGHAMAESSLNHASVSPANAIGTMQVIPSSGEWASQMVGRKLNLLDPQDNVTAGVAIIRHLQRTSPNMDIGIASYYQGAAGVRRHGMYPDTRQYVAKVKRYMQQF